MAKSHARSVQAFPPGRIERGRRMGVPVESVAVGKYYLTEIGQIRRVLEIKEAMVKYESRGKTAHGGSWGALTTISIIRFAGMSNAKSHATTPPLTNPVMRPSAAILPLGGGPLLNRRYWRLGTAWLAERRLWPQRASGPRRPGVGPSMSGGRSGPRSPESLLTRALRLDPLARTGGRDEHLLSTTRIRRCARR
jgi:hypothetical protein